MESPFITPITFTMASILRFYVAVNMFYINTLQNHFSSCKCKLKKKISASGRSYWVLQTLIVTCGSILILSSR